MKKIYSLGLLVLALLLVVIVTVACGTKEETTTTVAEVTETTVAEVTETTVAVTGSEIGMQFKDEGNNVVYITDAVEPGMAYPISTSNGDFSSKVWAIDASGAKVADFTTLDGYVDYTSVVGKAVKILVQGPFGDPFEYTIPN
jgi:hypothetical protein